MYHLRRTSFLTHIAWRRLCQQQQQQQKPRAAAVVASWLMPADKTQQQQQQQRRHLATTTDAGVGITVARKKGASTGYCFGCGADLVKGTSGSMATAPKKTGYWAQKQQDLKISKIKNWALCPRCKTLNQGDVVIGNNKDHVKNLAPDTKMTRVFREQVTKIRQKQNAVVVLCVDATNVSGTLIGTIRNYVGGNPILLAITRCDLLPDYIVKDNNAQEQLRHVFAERAKEIKPANVYLCSVDQDYIHGGGVADLANDLWQHLNGRDPYIVGAANIGKSTLTDLLITEFIKRGDESGHFKDRLARKRFKALQESRVTKSALPGTTLQNIRVPCFQDHTQALWDTPGLLLDESLKHFPIRNFRQLRAQRPRTIEPQILQVTEKSFALVICEKGDELPLVRMEIRLKRNAQDEGPVRLVWNSILDLDVRIMDIDVARRMEEERAADEQESVARRDGENNEEEDDYNGKVRTKKEKEQRKAERKRAYDDRIKQEQKELGNKEWKRRREEKAAQDMEERRTNALAKLFDVCELICEGGFGMDIVVANFGWLGILPPRPAMVKVFAPSTGVRVTHHAALALPSSWGEYKRLPSDEEEIDSDEEGVLDDEESGWDDDEDDMEYGWDDEDDMEYGWDDDEGYSNKSGSTDSWKKYSGENIGWQFDADTRWSKGKIFEGWNPSRPPRSDD